MNHPALPITDSLFPFQRDIVQWALDMDTSGPVAIENIKGEMPAKDALYNVATAFHFEAVYANGVRMIVDSSFREGIEFIGENGKKIFVKRDLIEFTPQELRSEQIKPEEIDLRNRGAYLAAWILSKSARV